MTDDLLKSILAASDALMDAHRKARAAGREDLAQYLRHAAWDVAAALANAVKDQGAKGAAS